MIELGIFKTDNGKRYAGHYIPENHTVEAVGPLPEPLARDVGARGVVFTADATSVGDARNKIEDAIGQGKI